MGRPIHGKQLSFDVLRYYAIQRYRIFFLQ